MFSWVALRGCPGLKPGVRTSDFNFVLPPGLIAQAPAPERDRSRLLVVHRSCGALEHRSFGEFACCLRAGDVLVLNNSRVIPARLRGLNARTGGEFEVLLLETADEMDPSEWWAMMRPGKRARFRTEVRFLNRAGTPSPIHATVVGQNAEGHRRLRFSGADNLLAALSELGEVPLPPYIKRERAADLTPDVERYQTVYAQVNGSVAAPTAGLHFTPALLAQLRQLGVQLQFVTLHVGLGTFAPVTAESLAAHVMHEERYAIDEPTASAVNAAKREQRRVIAVGTTSVRVLESVAAQHAGQVVAGAGRTRIFIHPPFRFQIVDALLTNFHLPCSTLLMLVSAFAAAEATHGRALVLQAYAEAIRERYRFFSYGDAMLVL
jgi:S-adenosylmethionine:tRNA ribosyltransferase-isomerase